jgi:hypothetical protein
MSQRINSHTISHAENLFSGDAYQAGANDSGRGLPIRLVVEDVIKATNIVAEDPNGYVAAAVTPAAGAVALNGALVVAGVGVADVARAVQIVASGVGDTTQSVTVTGKDQYDNVMVETIGPLTGVTPVDGKKAFKEVTGISLDITMTTNLDVGTNTVIGLNYRLDDIQDIDFAIQGGDVKVAGDGAGTPVVADTTLPATATTGDVRGTYLVDAEPFPLKLVYKVAGRNTVGAYGVPQFAG